MIRLFLTAVLAGCFISCTEDRETQRHLMYLVPSDDFVITVQTDLTGSSENNQFTIWAFNDGSGSYNYDVDCNDDGIWERTNLNNQYICNYASLGGAGTYTVRIRGTFPRFRAYSHFTGTTYIGDHRKIRTVEQWGTNPWVTLERAFKEAEFVVINATDTPNLQNVTSVSRMFQNATSIGIGAGNWDWDTSNVEDMYTMFQSTRFDKDISSWDVSNVKNMESMFESTPFNQDISGWDTRSVENFSAMFRDATDFNQDVGAWNTSAATDFSAMFSSAAAFDQDLSNWDVSQGVNFGGMFFSTMFNAPISNWNMSTATRLSGMFKNTPFNQDISGWNTSNAESASGMFENTPFNQNISGWNTSKFEYVGSMFKGATNFNQDIGNWDMSNVRYADNMFNGATSFDRNLSSWNVERFAYLTDFIKDGRLSTTNYDALLISWASQSVKENHIGRRLDFDGGNSTYCLGEASRQSLITNKQWTFVDGGKLCSVNLELSQDVQVVESNQVYVPKLLILGTLETPATVSVIDQGNGSATSGLDYQFTNANITIPVGTYDGTLATAIDISDLTILDDEFAETDETVILTLSQPSTNALTGDTNNDGEISETFTFTIENIDVCSNASQCPGPQVCNLVYNPAVCQSADVCGNGALESDEFCDDGNVELADGCNSDCKIENGSECLENDACASGICDATNAPPVCEAIETCGNNIVEADEVCDDGNSITGDGCDDNCKLEDNIECDDDALCASGICDKSMTPGRCEPVNICGNNIIENGETCDDGGTIIGDGCDSLCAIEDAMNCVGDRNCPEGLVCTDGICGVECRSNGDCENGDCIFGQCVTCTQDSECEGTDQCQAGSCVASCTTNDECAPQGFCDERCVECLENAHCLESEICTEGLCDNPNVCDPNFETCENTCTSNTECTDARIPFCDLEASKCGECNDTQDCADNEVCVGSQTAKRCEPGCTADSCGEEICSDDGFCVDCLSNDHCDSGICNETICVSGCENDDDCSEDLKKCDTDVNLCVAECTSDSDCFLGTCTIETNTCKIEDKNAPPKDIIDDGCGCASSDPKVPLTPLIFCLFIAFVGIKRKAKTV